MAYVVANTGDLVIAKLITNTGTPTNLVLHLFSNTPTLAKTMTLADLTEVTISGYAPITLNGSWSYTQISSVTKATHPLQTFNFTAGGTIVGYHLVDGNGILIAVEIFSDGPYTIPSLGGQTGVQPNIVVN